MSIIEKIEEEAEKIKEKMFGEEKPKEEIVPTSDTQPGQAALDNQPAQTVPSKKQYMGKDIISDKMEVVNEKQYHSLKLVDGSTHLLSPSEYEELMK